MSKRKVEPITPQEVARNKVNALPPKVIEAFNTLITKHFNGVEACFTSKEVAKLIAEKCNVPIKDVYDNKWLDVEELFSQYGWAVEYDKPGYNEESYAPTFTFRKKR